MTELTQIPQAILEMAADVRALRMEVAAALRGHATAVSITEAARRLDVHPQTLRRMIKLNEIASRRIGRRVVVSVEDLNAYMKAQGKKPIL